MSEIDKKLEDKDLKKQLDDERKRADIAESKNTKYEKLLWLAASTALLSAVVYVYKNEVTADTRYNELSTKINGIKEINANMLDRIDQTQEKINTLKVKYLLLEEQYTDLKKLNNNLTLQVNALQK